MVIDRTISGYPFLDCTLRMFDACSDFISTRDFDMSIVLIDLSWLRIPMPWFLLRFTDYICLLHRHCWFILTDHIASLITFTRILPWLFWSLHMHTLPTVYHSTWHVDSLTCILFWSSLSMMSVSLFVLSALFSLILCGHEWFILYSAWLYDAWLFSFCVIVCRLSVWAAHISPYLQLSWFRSFFSSRFSLLQVWDLLCACSLTEPEIRSRV